MERPVSPDRSVEVFLDGHRIVVPEWADCHWAARGALGLPRGVGVARESDLSELLEFDGGHVFVAGERYITRDASHLFASGDDEHRQPWETDPETWKRAFR